MYCAQQWLDGADMNRGMGSICVQRSCISWSYDRIKNIRLKSRFEIFSRVVIHNLGLGLCVCEVRNPCPYEIKKENNYR
jgi:hypothetical protein